MYLSLHRRNSTFHFGLTVNGSCVLNVDSRSSCNTFVLPTDCIFLSYYYNVFVYCAMQHDVRTQHTHTHTHIRIYTCSNAFIVRSLLYIALLSPLCVIDDATGATCVNCTVTMYSLFLRIRHVRTCKQTCRFLAWRWIWATSSQQSSRSVRQYFWCLLGCVGGLRGDIYAATVLQM